MKFLRQIKFEIRNIVRSKFLLIIGILIILAGIAIPVIGLFGRNNQNGGIIEPTIGPLRESSGVVNAIDSKFSPVKPGMESITIDGVTITADNPYYWYIQNLISEKNNYEMNPSQFSAPGVLDLLLEMIDNETGYYVRFAQYIASYQDYRVELAWRGIESLSDKFFYEHADIPEKVLTEAASYRKGLDPDSFRNKYINITALERLQALAKADEYLDLVYTIVEKNDFPKYIDLRIKMENDQIASFVDNIAIQQQAIIDNPSQEENLNRIIEDLRRQIKIIETNNIPILQYRLEKNIVPGLNIWQNTAISDIENSRSQLAYMTIMTEEEFNNNQSGRDGGDIVYAQPAISYGKDYFYPDYGNNYDTYPEYVAYMQSQIDKLNIAIIIAQKSLDAGKPDMKYVPAGSRSKTVQFLDYSIIVALFGVLLGGWLIASEHQQGTIRLLMIRPKTRFKILAAKFLAALAVCLVVYLVGSLLNFITNGICYGFADYMFPNYSIGGETGFIAYFLPKLLVCMVPILFAFTIAFMLSVVVKNIAVSIAIPFVFFVGSIILTSIMAYSPSMSWLAFTPIPFIMLSTFFQRYSSIQNAIESGVRISLTYGVALLFVLSAVCAAISVLTFKKRDIVN
jgi:ABC-2 type transport system permease protein